MVEEGDIVKTLTLREGKFFVSHLDILGYKSFVRQSSTPTTLLSLFRLSNLVELSRGNEQSYFYGNYNTKTGELVAGNSQINIKYLNFTNYSDTIVMYIQATKNAKQDTKLLETLCQASNFFISKLILSNDITLIKPLALRCGIAYGHGKICDDIKTVTGPVFVDAYELCENQRWMGGAIHPNVPEEYCQPLIGYNNELYLYESKIPLKKDCSPEPPRYALNWVNSHPALPPSYSPENRNRDGPLLLDIGGHIKNFAWEEKSEYDKTHDTTFDKANNTLDFVVEIDKAWNNKCGVPKSTPDDFIPPPWYRPRPLI